MPKPPANQNCILYSNLAPINRESLLELVRKHHLSIVEIIEENPLHYKRANKQPELAKVFSMLEAGKAKFLVTESLNHLFTVNGYEVLRYFKVLHDLGVTIITPDRMIEYPNCSTAVLFYCDHRVEFLRTLAARAAIARGHVMGRQRVEVDLPQLVARVKHYGKVIPAAREMNLCNVTATRRLLEAGYDLDELRQGRKVILTADAIREKIAAARVVRERNAATRAAAKAAREAKVLEIKEK